jgi:hypothetical protein
LNILIDAESFLLSEDGMLGFPPIKRNDKLDISSLVKEESFIENAIQSEINTFHET